MRHLFDTVESWHCTLHADVVVVVAVLVVLVVFVFKFIRFLATNDCQAGKSFGERQRRKIITWLQWLTKSMSYIRSASVIQSLQYCNMTLLSWHIRAVCWFSSLSLKKSGIIVFDRVQGWSGTISQVDVPKWRLSRNNGVEHIGFCGVWFLQPPCWSQWLSIEMYPLVFVTAWRVKQPTYLIQPFCAWNPANYRVRCAKQVVKRVINYALVQVFFDQQ